MCTRGELQKTKQFGKQFSISVSISPNLVEQPIFLFNAYPQHVVASFLATLETVVSHSNVQKKTLFLDNETALKNRMNRIVEHPSQRHSRRGQVTEAEVVWHEENSHDIFASTHILHLKENQLIDLQEHFERFCNTLPVFEFNKAKHGINLIKSNLLPMFINERDIEPVVTEKANHYNSLKFGDIQLLDIMIFLVGATSLESHLKAYKARETKRYIPYEQFHHPD